jgi:hypothetical protein
VLKLRQALRSLRLTKASCRISSIRESEARNVQTVKHVALQEINQPEDGKASGRVRFTPQLDITQHHEKDGWNIGRQTAWHKRLMLE